MMLGIIARIIGGSIAGLIVIYLQDKKRESRRFRGKK